MIHKEIKTNKNDRHLFARESIEVSSAGAHFPLHTQAQDVGISKSLISFAFSCKIKGIVVMSYSILFQTFL